MDPGWQVPIRSRMTGPFGDKPYRAVILKDYKPLARKVKDRKHSKEDTYPLT